MKTILFIEDEAGLQKTLGSALEQEGFRVISALNGEIGLRLAKENPPELILLDLILPRKNGFEVLKSLREDDATRRVPVIVLTNLEDISDIQKVLDAGATTYLVKSNYSLEEIVEKIKQAASGHED